MDRRGFLGALAGGGFGAALTRANAASKTDADAPRTFLLSTTGCSRATGYSETNKMHKDEIIADVRRNRDAYARAHHNNLDEIVADLRKRQQAHPERVVDRRIHRTAESNTTSG